ncbi:membrane protein [Candidatus Magnetobacterium bavaricum]|uniref:Membrane protein n=1 Tax=Candidatus Magnetobacterium bavaricum TaxID=29290 RepID=A0A0F3GPW4_9BACT|nr:membrane protein [Candidatus Magnetobacterium bavaricum]
MRACMALSSATVLGPKTVAISASTSFMISSLDSISSWYILLASMTSAFTASVYFFSSAIIAS